MNSEQPSGGEEQQTDQIEALTEAVDEHYDDDQCGAPVGSVVEEMLTDPTIDIGDVAYALREGYFHGVIYQPSQSTVARVSADGGFEQLQQGGKRLIGYIIGPEGDAITVCDDCAESPTDDYCKIHDSDAYGDEVAYPECWVCGGLLRPSGGNDGR